MTSAALSAPPAFHLMTKPTGAICNLDCKYCFFLSKEHLYPGSRFRMTDEVLEAYIRQLVEAHGRVPEIVIAWQGGEPTLMGVDFFRRAAELANRFKKPGQTIQYAFQTNGILLNDAWGAFFREHDVLVGISIDGPRELHDAYRVDKGGRPTHVRVLRGLEVLKKHGVEWNVLCTLHRANADYPLEVYRFFRDDLGARFIQFIPIVERDNDTGFQEGDAVTDRSVTAEQYGRFLNAVFDEWVRRDVGRVFVQSFDVALGQWVGAPPTLCVHSPTCGGALALEHNGDLYSCDHFVEPDYLLGNVMEREMGELVASPKQKKFGRDKLETLPRYCRECEVRFACHGGCPKDRFIRTPDGEPGLNYLCAGYKAFFSHIDGPMRLMASLIRQGRQAEEVMGILGGDRDDGPRRKPARPPTAARAATPGRNDPCPCGSGRKFKKCHGRMAAV